MKTPIPIPKSCLLYTSSKVYCMNEEYQFIHEFLDRNPQLKEYFIYEYSLKRVRNYFWNYGRIAKEFRLEYLYQLSKEFKEAMNLKAVSYTHLPRKYEK